MSNLVFKNQTTDIISGIYPANSINNGYLQVNIAGVLDGADVITYKLNETGVQNQYTQAPSATCSWRSSKGETISDGAGYGIDLLFGAKIQFAIINAGASTNITLSFDLGV